MKEANIIAQTLEEINAAKIKYQEACKAFSSAFRKRREAEKLSLRSVAKAIGVSAAYLSDMELGRRPPNLDMRTYFS